MKRNIGSLVVVNNFMIEDKMEYNGETVLSYKIEYPQFISVHYEQSLKAINRYYLKKAYSIQRYYRSKLYKLAVEQYIYSKENNFPIRIYEGITEYKITYNMACVISLFFDNYIYSGGAHGNTERTSDTWDLQRNKKFRLSEFFGCSLDYRNYIFQHIKTQVQKEPVIYFDDYEKLILENFKAQNFYCTPKGIVLYYQQYDIAPYSSGIRKFLIPYTDCVINPYKICNLHFK